MVPQEGEALLRRVPEIDLVMGPQYANRYVLRASDTTTANEYRTAPADLACSPKDLMARTRACAVHLQRLRDETAVQMAQVGYLGGINELLLTRGVVMKAANEHSWKRSQMTTPLYPAVSSVCAGSATFLRASSTATRSETDSAVARAAAKMAAMIALGGG
eukprot:4261480-Pleurochrysis_carterae.AAC.2